jgi:CMP-2-keto-3-deoxyoctulosonic acid synthetase
MARPKGLAKTGGRAKGTPNHATIDKALKREELRRLICAHLTDMTHAQVANAKGIKYLVTRHKNSGKFIRVTEAMAKVKLGDDEEIIEVWEKDPSVQAYTDLLNRALDKPAEQVQVTGPEGGPLEIVLKIPW